MSARLRIVFAGTPEFAVPCLEAVIASGHELVAVYTQPDRPAGRGRQLQASPVKQRALEAGIAVEQPERLKPVDAQERLRAYAPDLMVVVAYGLLLPQAVLDIPRYGCWNVHASLLPRWRGAAPIQRALLAGDHETGVCLMQMERGLDTGPVLSSLQLAIGADENAASLHDRLATAGARLLGEGIARLAAEGPWPPTAQPELGATYAHKLDKSEARLDPRRSARELTNAVRAFNPWPVAELTLGGERLRIWAATPLDLGSKAPAGTLIAAGKAGLDLACGEGVLRITELQRDGGRRMRAADLVNARPAWLSGLSDAR